MPQRPVWKGSQRKLVIAFDLGTTYSGISYSILEPGQIPVVYNVTKFPSQEEVNGASKIPSVIYYDQEGTVRAVGAEAHTEEMYCTAMENNWVKAEWFKLHLRPKHDPNAVDAANFPPLPPNKTVVDVVADFLKYLHHCARAFICETHVDGNQIWESVEGDIDYVLTHPNGWEGSEQTQMRRAAVLAGLVPSMGAGDQRISLVSEGEASLHFAVQHGFSANALQGDNGAIIVDAGGGTIDVSAYRRIPDPNESESRRFEEIYPAQCYFSGSVFVTVHARLFLRNFLAESKFIEDLDHMERCFDTSAKLRFNNDQQAQLVRFGSPRDNDEKRNIRFGQLKLEGSDVASFFQPSIDSIVKAVLAVKEELPHYKIPHVLLVGGFAASDWLYHQVRDGLADRVTVVRPNTGVHLSKVVSDGAVAFYFDHFVGARMTKVAYGIPTRRYYEPANPDHVRRKDTIVIDNYGRKRLPNGFRMIIPKNTRVREGTEIRYPAQSSLGENPQKWDNWRISISCYRGDKTQPLWLDDEKEHYSHLCKLVVDFTKCPKAVKLIEVKGDTVYIASYEIVLSFGYTEIKAQVAWTEDGVEKRSPASIIYYDNDPTEQIAA